MKKEDDFEEWDDTDVPLKDGEKEEQEWEEEWEDEPKPLASWVMVLIFLGMFLLAVLICLVLWRFTHSGQEEGNGQDSSAHPAAASEMPSDSTSESGVTSSSDSTPGSAAASSDSMSESAAASSTGTTSEDAVTSAPEPTPEASATSVSEPTPEAPVTPAPQTPQAGASSDGQAKDPISGTAAMAFSESKESVTPKDVVNLRSVPTTTDETNIVAQAQNGEVLSRTGINQDTGWSRIDYKGQTLYAVTQFLTTDLEYKTPVQPSDPNRVNTISGRIIIFTNCDDWISPKEYVNLRTEPSTTEGDTTVSCQLNYGEKAHRTGYSADSGWSRVEYNGQVLYVVTSLMYEVAE